MHYDFDTIVPRRGTDCEKWDSPEDGVLPLWVADMDFRAAPAIVDALRRRVDEGVFGYAKSPSFRPPPSSARTRSCGSASAELARRLEQEAKVKFSPGSIYGEEDGSSFLRVNLACQRATLLEALERTADFIK